MSLRQPESRPFSHAFGGFYRFFEDYKKNEHKEVKVDEILGREEAFKAIKESMVRLRPFWHVRDGL